MKMNDLMKIVVNKRKEIGDSRACVIGEALKVNSSLITMWLNGGVLFMYYGLIEIHED